MMDLKKWFRYYLNDKINLDCYLHVLLLVQKKN